MSAKSRIGQQLGNYRLLRYLGHNKFTETYLGEHLHLKTQLTINILHIQLAEKDVQDLLTEVRTIAQLDHPHILRILDFDALEGSVFFVTSYTPNGNLRQKYLRGTRLPLPTVINYVNQIAEALHCMHNNNIAHRNIKPENIVIGRLGELLLSDFGLSSILAESTHSQDIQDLGEDACYTAPEQFRGKPQLASDQYALGIVTYEWLSGNCPFQGTFEELYAQHLFEPPPSLHEKNPAIPLAVEQVILRALEKIPEERFPDVKAFANELEQTWLEIQIPQTEHLDDSPLANRRFSRRTALIGVTGLAIIAGFGGLLSRLLLSTAPSSTTHLTGTGTLPGATRTGSVPTQQLSSTAITPLATVSIYTGINAQVSKVVWSPDGSRLAAVGGGTLHIWNPYNGQPIIDYSNLLPDATGHSFSTSTLAWSPDGNALAIGGAYYIATQNANLTLINKVHILDLNIGHSRLAYGGHTDMVRDVAWSPDGKRLASASDDDTVQVWDAATGKTLVTYRGQPPEFHNGVRAVSWSPDGKRIASSSRNGYNNGLVKVWDSTTGGTLLTYENLNNRNDGYMVNSIAWSPVNNTVASQDTDNLTWGVHIWNPDTGKTRAIYKGDSGSYIYSVAWSRNGQRIAAAFDAKVHVWNVNTMKKLFTYTGHFGNVLTVAWSPDGTLVASGGLDQTVQVWQT